MPKKEVTKRHHYTLRVGSACADAIEDRMKRRGESKTVAIESLILESLDLQKTIDDIRKDVKEIKRLLTS